MSHARIRELMQQLREALEQQEEKEVDEATRTELRALETDIEALLEEQEDAPDSESIIARAAEAEARFAARHPVAGGFLRQLIDSLSRMGI